MGNLKLAAGSDFPVLDVAKLGGGQMQLGKPAGGFPWQMVVVYRGKHCPLCTKYLRALNALLPRYHKEGVFVVAVSADSADKALQHMREVNPDFPVGFDLAIPQMQQLGLYISNPRSPQETDRPFAEPGIFVVNEAGRLQIVDISNAPFARPDLQTLLMGIEFIRNPENNYPIRGTY
ncbi:redoxin domain-containing protein [Microbulbifer sp. THAF38]|uniref:redoxin domain-containing protein n=1 Tax=Microbulbifer sp. THAF38 TaxID=2587856 RepID=UPI0012681A49|nr:redoxin domain-containing protein [Microbulbifer sp. THAF38]QFT55880.1 Thiol-disulfide oxidoreductase ResA [Microbulbifer sp. THAF38]